MARQIRNIAVIGSGTMGSGIAQLSAMRGHPVVLLDSNQAVLEKALTAIHASIDKQIQKGALSASEGQAVKVRVQCQRELAAIQGADLVVEAIVENLEAKREVFKNLEATVGPECILATNTSSLSVAAIAGSCEQAHRVVGLHFFNPATLLPLVEIVPHRHTDSAVVHMLHTLMQHWGKAPVTASDTPGFIVNRIARPFYGEALRIFEERIADPATIDWAMRETAGFKMGPFELMDLIGNDVNYAVTESVFKAMYYDPRYKPSLIQCRMVEAGLLGRKSGQGYYSYGEGSRNPEPHKDNSLAAAIVNRVVAMLINEAVDALYLGIATAEDIETAMLKGVNYPRGLLHWCDELGAATVLARIDALHEEYRDSRYRASILLRRLAKEQKRIFA